MLQTEVKIERQPIIDHSSVYFVVGSCFAENIGRYLQENRFEGITNPFGIMYNPLSIAECLTKIIRQNLFVETDLFEHNGLWHSNMHHSSFSNSSKDEILTQINRNTAEAYQTIKTADFLIVTFGSSYVYKQQDKIVANCHKLPECNFVRLRLSTDEIVERFTSVIDELKTINPKIRIIFSVSPIRYFRDGAFCNSLNKAVLLLSAEKLLERHKNSIYFPAYEIVVDELRDYRFYADDMIHPSSLTKKIVWQKFAETFFTNKTLEILPKIDKLNKLLKHKVLNSYSHEFDVFETKKRELENQVSQYLCSLAQIQEK